MVGQLLLVAGFMAGGGASSAAPLGRTDLPGVVGLPFQGYTLVTGGRTLGEDWGTVTVRLEGEGAVEALTAPAGCDVPVVRARSVSGGCELVTTVFRAPTEPGGSDAIEAVVANHSEAPATARLVLAHTASGEGVTLSEEALAAGTRRLIALPGYAKPTLPMNDWGLASNASAVAGWANPDRACDPAFRNIRVGWYGAPITYRFRVEAGGARLVMLGVCESHWAEGGKRPLILQVEGAPDVPVDPVRDWGRHVPKCVPFEGKDANGDGWLAATSICPPKVVDANSILNAIWVFPAGAAEDPEAVVRGERSDRAECYVDVGGQRDQSLYGVGDVIYDLALQPREKRTLTFLTASRGGGAPAPPKTASEAGRYWADAERLWGEWLAGGCRVSLPEPGAEQVWRASLHAIMMARGQVSKYVVPLPNGDLSSFSYGSAHAIIRALDVSGHHKEAEECLLMLWDGPLPEPIAKWGQQEGGSWGGEGDYRASAHALGALVEHFLLTRDREWLADVYPAAQKGAEWIRRQAEVGDPRLSLAANESPPDAPVAWAAKALRSATVLAAASGHAADANWTSRLGEELQRGTTTRAMSLYEDYRHGNAGGGLRAAIASASPQGFWPSGAESEAPSAFPDALEAAMHVVLMRTVLVHEREGEVALLAGAAPEWMAGGVTVERAPTTFGPVSFRARIVRGVLKAAITPPPRLPAAVRLWIPSEEEPKARRAEVSDARWKVASVSEEGAVVLTPAATPVVVSVYFE